MKGNDDKQFDALAALKDELEMAATRRRHGSRRRLAIAYGGTVALVAAALTFTAPGAALAEKVTSMLGIGSPSSLPPAQRNFLEPRDRGVVIASGATPDGDTYEVVGSYAEQAEPLGDAREGHVLTCLTVDFVEFPEEESGEICVGEGEAGTRYIGAAVIDGVQPGDRFSDPSGRGRDLDAGRYYLYGLVGSEVERIEVSYIDAEGETQAVEGDIGWIDPGIADNLGLRSRASRAGMMIAFLPDDGLPPFSMGPKGPTRSEPGHPGSAVITGFDADGAEVVSRDLANVYAGALRSAGHGWRARHAFQEWSKRRGAATVPEPTGGLRRSLK